MVEKDPLKTVNKALFRDDFFSSFFGMFDKDFYSVPDLIQDFDIEEKEDSYVVKAVLPSIKKEAVNISFENNYLYINVKSNKETEFKNEKYESFECCSSEYGQMLYLNNVDGNNIASSFENDILKIILPKRYKGNNNKKQIYIN